MMKEEMEKEKERAQRSGEPEKELKLLFSLKRDVSIAVNINAQRLSYLGDREAHLRSAQSQRGSCSLRSECRWNHPTRVHHNNR